MLPTTQALSKPTPTRRPPRPCAPSTLLRIAFDWLDQRRARRLRDDFGRRGWLLSWSRADGPGDRGPWVARLSCRELPLTVERRSRSLVRAIRRAEGALRYLLASPESEPRRRPD